MHARNPEARARHPSAFAIARRTLLIGGGAGVGLAIGWLAWPRAGRPALPLAPGEAELSGWLKIAPTGIVTVICPQAEEGQGVHTALAQLLADELGADWRTVTVEPAPLHPLYANRMILADDAGELAGPLAPVAQWTAAHLAERFDAQATVGSTSVRAFDAPMRLAGAQARVLMMKAAARRWGTSWRECDTRGGFVVNGARRVRFADLAADAAGERPERNPPLRPVPPLGRSAPRLDAPAKTDGSARFGADVRLPGMVFASIRHGPLGVTARPTLSAPTPPSVVFGPGWVAATGETWWAADQTLQSFDLRWPAPAQPADSDTIIAALRATLTDMPPPPGSGRLVEAIYTVPFMPHASAEPMTATARIEGDRAEIWAPTQSTRLATVAAARALGIAEAHVTVYPTYLGGGFGRKLETDAIEQAVLIARAAGRPVQLVWPRSEDLARSFPRPAAAARLIARLGTDATIAGWRKRIAVPDVAGRFVERNLNLGIGRADPGTIAGAAAVPYGVGDYVAEHVAAPSAVPPGYWRGGAHSYTAFFTESFVDELAAAAGKDPLAFRLALLGQQPRHAACLRAAAESAGYQPGMGVALHECFGSITAQICELRPGALQPARITCAIDIGRAVNPDGVRQQIEGGVIWGLAAALGGGTAFKGGWAQKPSLAAQRLPTLADTPAIDTVILTGPGPIGGAGEAGVPGAAPALANAIAARTGRRLRDLPLTL